MLDRPIQPVFWAETSLTALLPSGGRDVEYALPYGDMLLRPAEPDDVSAVARVHVGSSQTAYRTLMPDEYAPDRMAVRAPVSGCTCGCSQLSRRDTERGEDGAMHEAQLDIARCRLASGERGRRRRGRATPAK